eukprot:g3786.t1
MDKKREMERKRADVLKRLETRSRQRREKSEREKEKRAEMEDPRESSDLFWKEFKVSRKEIEDMIESCSKKYEKETRKERRRRRKDPESDPATKDFLNISNVLVGLQKYVTSSSYFLAKYDLRIAQENVNELETSLQNLKNKIRPAKKFTFSNVRQRVKKGESARDAAAKQKKMWTEQKRGSDVKKAEELRDGKFDTGFVFANKTDTTLRIPPLATSDIDSKMEYPDKGKDVTLGNLKNCTVAVCVRLGTLRLTNVRDCEIYCGPIDGSVFVNDCTNCRFVLASRQLRIHDTINCVFEVQTNSGPIIEDCDHLRFGPYPQISYNQSDLDFRESTLDMSVKNAWCDVKDFKWHRTQASPHWSKLDIRDRRGDLKDAKSLGISFVDVLNASKSPSIVAATNTTTTTTTLNEDKSSDEEL